MFRNYIATGMLVGLSVGSLFDLSDSFSAASITRLASGSWGFESIDAAGASLLEDRQTEVIVAILDTGTDIHHPDLEAAIWTNPGESGQVDSEECRNSKASRCDKSRNQIDDDGNGFVDDVHGWNFAQNNSDLADRHGHGTHVAGIVAEITKGLSPGHAGPKVRLMILKYTDPTLPCGEPLLNSIEAIRYATKMGAQVINYSAGGRSPNRLERQAIAEAGGKGILFIAAAGNEAYNSDVYGYYPADYDLPNVLSVTAHNPQKRVLASSNYGRRSVHIAAPGEKILSTLPGGKYGLMTGTSQATAFASGAVALLIANRKGKVRPEVILRDLEMSGEKTGSLDEKTRSGASLNLRRLLVMHDDLTSANGVTLDESSGPLDPQLLVPFLEPKF